MPTMLQARWLFFLKVCMLAGVGASPAEPAHRANLFAP
jgi:hypothetical protein